MNAKPQTARKPTSRFEWWNDDEEGNDPAPRDWYDEQGEQEATRRDVVRYLSRRLSTC